MARQQAVTIGDRTFTVAAITLGTARRVPDAFRVALARRESNEQRMPSPDEFAALVTLLHDGINQATPHAISLDDLNKLVDDLDIGVGIRHLTAAVNVMTQLSMNGVNPSEGDSGGNANSSKVAPSPASSD